MPEVTVRTSSVLAADAASFGRGLAELLKEYAGKLEAIIAETRQLRAAHPRESKQRFFGSNDWRFVSAKLDRLAPALQAATREASQLAEQGKIEDLTRVELRVRLAEVEGLLNAAQQLTRS